MEIKESLLIAFISDALRSTVPSSLITSSVSASASTKVKA